MSITLKAAGIFVVLGVAALIARGRQGPAQAASVVDSVVPREVGLERFQAGLARIDSLEGAATTRDELVRRFLDALASRDTATLRGLVMSKREYAWIYYPTTPQGLPPYDLSPSLLWFLIEGRSSQGLSQAMESRGGRPLPIARYSCDATPSIEGGNKVWGPCMVYRVQAPGDTVAERLFGPILERNGRFKFLSYANKL